MARGFAHELRDEPIRGEPAVAIHETVIGSDREGGIGDDQIEALASGGLVEGACAELDVADPVQRGIEGRDRERARIHVAGDDLRGVSCQQQRLSTAAGPDVEGPLDGGANRGPCQLARGRAEAEHVLGMRRSRSVLVEQQQQAELRREGERREDASVTHSEQPRIAPGGELAGRHGATRRALVDVGAQQEETDQRVERRSFAGAAQ